MKTYMAKAETVQRKWYVVDAEGMVLGRLASQVAAILRGKNKPTFTPHVDTGDHVIVLNADKVVLTGDINQYFAVLTNMRSVGVMGDERTYDFTVALRAVCTVDFMTVDWARIPYDVLARASARIVNEVRSVNRVVYDITTKPPATIEWE